MRRRGAIERTLLLLTERLPRWVERRFPSDRLQPQLMLLVAVTLLGAALALASPPPRFPAVDQASIDTTFALLWVIGGGVALMTIATVVFSMVGRITREESAPDERDVRISHASERVGTAFLVIAGIVAIVLCAQAASPFFVPRK